MALNLKYYKILDIIYDNANIVSNDSTANNWVFFRNIKRIIAEEYDLVLLDQFL